MPAALDTMFACEASLLRLAERRAGEWITLATTGWPVPGGLVLLVQAQQRAAGAQHPVGPLPESAGLPQAVSACPIVVTGTPSSLASCGCVSPAARLRAASSRDRRCPGAPAGAPRYPGGGATRSRAPRLGRAARGVISSPARCRLILLVPNSRARRPAAKVTGRIPRTRW
jgi:hypothetical protein